MGTRASLTTTPVLGENTYGIGTESPRKPRKARHISMKAPDTISLTDEGLLLSLDKGLYPLDAIYGAAYIFIDRAYLFLNRVGDTITVHFTPRLPDVDQDTLQAIAGEFANELLNQVLRKRIARENQGILETIVTQALAGASGATAPMGLPGHEEDDDLDFLDDPLGIAVPWEDRFKKKGDDAAPAQPDEEPANE